MADQKIVLAYSGGLDTSCILKYLQEKGYQVVAFIADLGQEDDMSVLERRAHEQGAVAVHVVDLRRAFVTEFVLPAIAGNALYENRYLLGTSLARPLIARGQVEVALAEGAGWVSHGATGKGNDQVRFELAYAALAPQLRVFAPWKDAEYLARFKGRTDMLRYAEQHGLKLDVTVDKPWSTDENLMHKSYEAGLLEDPAWAPPDEMFTRTRSPQEAPGPAGRSRAPLRVVAPGRSRPSRRGPPHHRSARALRRAQPARRRALHRPRRHGGEPIRRHQVARRLRDPGRHHPVPGAARSRGPGDGSRGAARARPALAALRAAHLQRLLVQSRDGRRSAPRSRRPSAASTGAWRCGSTRAT